MDVSSLAKRSLALSLDGSIDPVRAKEGKMRILGDSESWRVLADELCMVLYMDVAQPQSRSASKTLKRVVGNARFVYRYRMCGVLRPSRQACIHVGVLNRGRFGEGCGG